MFLIRAPQQGRIWGEFKKRTIRVSATEMSCLFDANKYTSRQKLIKEKKGMVSRKNVDNMATRHGIDHEPIARDLLSEKLGEDWTMKLVGCVCDPDVLTCCSPDGMLYSKSGDVVKGVELKCPFRVENIPDSKEGISLQYLIQSFVCLHVTRADAWLLVFFDCRTQRLSGFEISPDSCLWEEVFLPELSRFQKDLKDKQLRLPSKAEKKEREIKRIEVREKLMKLTKPILTALE